MVRRYPWDMPEYTFSSKLLREMADETSHNICTNTDSSTPDSVKLAAIDEI